MRNAEPLWEHVEAKTAPFLALADCVFDALPGLSHEAGVAEQRPLAPGGAGHG